MARTDTEIYEELAALAHPLFVETAPGRAILKALAKLLSVAELAWDGTGGWFDQLFRQKAEGEWLDLHGEQVGVERRGGEADALYRERAYQRPTELTVAEVERLTSEWLAMQGEGYAAVVTDPYDHVLDDGFFLDTETALLTEAIGAHDRPRYLGWIYLPIPEVTQPLEGAVLDEGFALGDEGFLGEDIQSIERPHIRGLLGEIESRQSTGIGYGITIHDMWQDAYSVLFE